MWPTARPCCAASATSSRALGRVLFVFLDGFGLGPAGPQNPLSVYKWPRLSPIVGARPVLGETVREVARLLIGVDATLAVEGTPQSATGQVSLFTGRNAAKELGFHLAAYPNRLLQGMLEQDNILKHVADAGGRATFANAYSAEYFEAVAAGKVRHSATTLSVLAAGLPFRLLDDLLAGRAVFWDITNAELRQRPGHEQVPLVEPEVAGGRLARLAAEHDLVLYECFQPDRLGHRKDAEAALAFLSDLDCFLGAAIASLPRDASLVLCSDHGNLEDMAYGGHTRNRVPLLVVGPAAEDFAGAADITHVAPAIYRTLGLDGGATSPRGPSAAGGRAGRD